MSHGGLERVRRQISDIEISISQLKTSAAEQSAIMKEDIHSFSKFFFSSADLATQYLKDQLSATSFELVAKHTTLMGVFKKVQSGEGHKLEDCEAMAAALAKEIQEKEKDKKLYKQNARAKAIYDELFLTFQKFTKDMFRKFKRFIQTPAELESNKEDGKLFADLNSQRERMNEMFGRTVPAAEPRIAYRDAPETLPKLPSFPAITTEAYQEVLNRYGSFALKETSHPSFVELKTLPTVNLEDGSFYEGQWSGHLRVGKGKALFRSGDNYEGYWVEDKPDILGRMVSCEGDVYEVRISIM